MIVSLSKRTEITCLFTSKRPLSIAYHWVGRSVMCAGPDCPACLLRTPKRFYYVAAIMQRHQHAFEMCESLAKRIEEFCSTMVHPEWRGVALRAHRATKRHEWSIDQMQIIDEKTPQCSDAVLVEAIARLYRVGGIAEGENLQAWLRRVQASQAALLQSCQLI